MLKLRQLYLRNVFIPLIVTLFVVGGVTYWSIKDIYLNEIKNALMSNVELIHIQLKNPCIADNLVKKIKKSIKVRVTIIRDDGKVLAESDKDKKSMDNHRFREEIKEARDKGVGSSIRHSHTIGRDLLYVAKRYNYHNEIYYIRVAKRIKPIYRTITDLGLKVGSVFLIFFIIIFYNIYHINARLEEEIKKISRFLINLTKKKKETYIESHFSKEFKDITKLLTKVATILAKRDKKKAKYAQNLKVANAQKDDIISAISHEFKNPITVINGYSKTLIEDQDINKEIRERFLQKIYSNGQRLSSLIDTLRLALKLDRDKIKLTFEECNLYELSNEIKDNLLITYPNRDIAVLGQKDVVVSADKVLLGVAITNLVENALKYSDDLVEVIVSKEAISIKDHGIGIEEKEIKNITKKFYRVSKNSWNNSLGLGLSIVANIVNLHGFKLEIQSQKNEGSEFRLIF